MNGWILLSHVFSKELFAYGNGKRIAIKQMRSIAGGDTSNNTTLEFPTHYGTHIDFPYHFDSHGKKGTDFQPDYFISNNVQIVNIRTSSILNYSFKKQDFDEHVFNNNTEILIINTGMGKYIKQDEYWNSNPGFSPDLADYFKEKMPNLRIIGFDSISLTGHKHREMGKEAHKQFLIEHDILVVEDMELSLLTNETQINKIIISPLFFANSDGAPVTIFAKING